MLYQWLSGFQPSYSTQDVLLYAADSWHEAIDAAKFVVAGILDLVKPPDCVNHDILLDKLAHHDVVGGDHA